MAAMSNAETLAFDIVVSGGSFAGLALCRALGQVFGPDLRIALVDRATGPQAPPPDARAFALSAASRRMLETLGVWRHLASNAQPVKRIDITDSGLEAGLRPVLLSYDNTVDGGEPASTIVPSAALSAALTSAVAADPAVVRIAPAEARGYTADSRGATVSLADGRTVTARLVVAAEGRRSALREAAGIKLVGRAFSQTGIVTTIAHDRPHEGRAVQHFLPAGPFAILPLTGNRSCITWTEERSEAARILALDDAGFLAEVDQRFGGKLGALRLAGPRQSWPLETHLARSYVAPRLAVIGDAAHIVHPIAGQGLNLALRDVAALVEVVADAARIGLDIGNAETLARYERWRRFDSWLSASTFDGLNRLFSNDWTLLRSAREFGLGMVDRLPGLKQAFVTEAAGLAGEVPRLLKGERVTI
ncbi:MAG: FAD-dependent monooxygenase [Hyphomicrobium sp.]